MKYIYLNAIVTIPNKNGEEKIEKANTRDEHTIDYEALGIIPPKGEVDYDAEGNIILNEEDLEDVTVPLTIPIENLDSWSSSIEGGTHIYTKSKLMYYVEEDITLIDSYIELATMSWWRRKKLSFLSFFRRKNKEQTESINNN